VLKSDGAVASNFAWSDPNDDRSPVDMLQSEGISVADGRADREKELTSNELAGLITSGVDS